MHRKHYAFMVTLGLVAAVALLTPSLAAQENHKPCLRQATVRPMEGVARTTFVATVEYSDIDGDVPAKVEVFIDNTAYSMRLIKGRAENGRYHARLTLPPGEHSYYFYAEDARGMSERYPRYGAKHGPYVGKRKPYNRPAFLTEGGVHFDHGTDKNIYTFSVYYRDRDEYRPPRAVRVVIDGIIHNMKLHKGNPNNGSYLYETVLPAAPHAYYFVATDGDGGCITHPHHGFLRGPEVVKSFNNPPHLGDKKIIPPIGNYRTKYAYTIHYRDKDFDVPSIALVYIDDIPQVMKLAAGRPYSGLYIFRTRHHVGYNHDYYFYFEDGSGGVCRYPDRGSFHGPVVTR